MSDNNEKILVEVPQIDFKELMEYVASNLQWDSNSKEKEEMFARLERFEKVERVGADAVGAG